MTYEDVVETLKAKVLEASLAQGELVNPLYREFDKLVMDITCTWNQMYKAMDLAEKEWNELKADDIIFLDKRHEEIKGELIHVNFGG